MSKIEPNKIAKKYKTRQNKLKTKLSTADWVQKILNKTTRKPTPPPPPPTTTTTTTTTTPPPTTTSAPPPVLTKELQTFLRKLLARKQITEQSQPRYPEKFFTGQQVTQNDNRFDHQIGSNPNIQTNNQVFNQQQSVGFSPQPNSNYQPQQQISNNPLQQTILRQQQLHQDFLQKNRFRLHARHNQPLNYQQESHFQQNQVSPKQKQFYPRQDYSNGSYNQRGYQNQFQF